MRSELQPWQAGSSNAAPRSSGVFCRSNGRARLRRRSVLDCGALAVRAVAFATRDDAFAVVFRPIREDGWTLTRPASAGPRSVYLGFASLAAKLRPGFLGLANHGLR